MLSSPLPAAASPGAGAPFAGAGAGAAAPQASDDLAEALRSHSPMTALTFLGRYFHSLSPSRPPAAANMVPRIIESLPELLRLIFSPQNGYLVSARYDSQLASKLLVFLRPDRQFVTALRHIDSIVHARFSIDLLKLIPENPELARFVSQNPALEEYRSLFSRGSGAAWPLPTPMGATASTATVLSFPAVDFYLFSMMLFFVRGRSSIASSTTSLGLSSTGNGFSYASNAPQRIAAYAECILLESTLTLLASLSLSSYIDRLFLFSKAVWLDVACGLWSSPAPSLSSPSAAATATATSSSPVSSGSDELTVSTIIGHLCRGLRILLSFTRRDHRLLASTAELLALSSAAIQQRGTAAFAPATTATATATATATTATATTTTAATATTTTTTTTTSGTTTATTTVSNPYFSFSVFSHRARVGMSPDSVPPAYSAEMHSQIESFRDNRIALSLYSFLKTFFRRSAGASLLSVAGSSNSSSLANGGTKMFSRLAKVWLSFLDCSTRPSIGGSSLSLPFVQRHYIFHTALLIEYFQTAMLRASAKNVRRLVLFFSRRVSVSSPSDCSFFEMVFHPDVVQGIDWSRNAVDMADYPPSFLKQFTMLNPAFLKLVNGFCLALRTAVSSGSSSWVEADAARIFDSDTDEADAMDAWERTMRRLHRFAAVGVRHGRWQWRDEEKLRRVELADAVREVFGVRAAAAARTDLGQGLPRRRVRRGWTGEGDRQGAEGGIYARISSETGRIDQRDMPQVLLGRKLCPVVGSAKATAEAGAGAGAGSGVGRDRPSVRPAMATDAIRSYEVGWIARWNLILWKESGGRLDLRFAADQRYLVKVSLLLVLFWLFYIIVIAHSCL